LIWNVLRYRRLRCGSKASPGRSTLSKAAGRKKKKKQEMTKKESQRDRGRQKKGSAWVCSSAVRNASFGVVDERERTKRSSRVGNITIKANRVGGPRKVRGDGMETDVRKLQ